MFYETTELQIIRIFTIGGLRTKGRSVSINMRNAQGDDLLYLDLTHLDMCWAEDVPDLIDDIFFDILRERVYENKEIQKIPVNNKLYVGESFIEESSGNRIALDEVKKIKKSNSNPYIIKVIPQNKSSKPIIIDLSVNEKFTKTILANFFPILKKSNR